MATIFKNLPRIGTKLQTKLTLPLFGVVRLGCDVATALPARAKKVAERTCGARQEVDFDLNGDGVADVTRIEGSLDGHPYVMYRCEHFVIYGGVDGRVHLIENRLGSGEVIVLGDQTANFDGAFVANHSPLTGSLTHATDRNDDGKVDLVTWRAEDGTHHFRVDDDFDGRVDREGVGQP